MTDYPFAELDRIDLSDVKELEDRLSSKHGKQIILIAYKHDAMGDDMQSLSALADGDDPKHYGEIQAKQETGWRLQ